MNSKQDSRFLGHLWAVAATVALAAMCSCAAEQKQEIVTDTTASTVAPTSTTLGTRQLLEHARNSVLRVRNTGCGELSVGSAWLAPDGAVISNRHVVSGAQKIELSTWDGRDIDPTGAVISDAVDISKISGPWANTPDLKALPIRGDRVTPGERIAVVGFPEGEELAISTGVAVGYGPSPDPEEPIEVLKATTLIRPGNSGGPALDSLGRVVGVAFAEELAVDEALIIPIQTVVELTAADLHQEQTCRLSQ